MKATDIRNIFISNGSDDILNFAFLAFAGGGGRKVFFPDITYGFYQVFADLHGISAEIIPLQEDFSINIEDYCSLPFSGGLICIANPNAPTGIPLTTEDIEKSFWLTRTRLFSLMKPTWTSALNLLCRLFETTIICW